MVVLETVRLRGCYTFIYPYVKYRYKEDGYMDNPKTLPHLVFGRPRRVDGVKFKRHRFCKVVYTGDAEPICYLCGNDFTGIGYLDLLVVTGGIHTICSFCYDKVTKITK